MLVIYVMVKSYKKVVCIKVGESLYKNKNCFELELNKVYLVDESWIGKANGGNYFIVMRDDMTFGHVLDTKYFITLCEWREQQINDILG